MAFIKDYNYYPCYFVIFSVVICLCNASCGNYVGVSGNKYDLSPLTQAADYSWADEYSRTYYYNYCKNINVPTACVSSTPVAQVSPTGTCFSLGFLPPTLVETGVGSLTITYTNNVDLCGNPRTIPRTSTFLLSCALDTDYLLVNVAEPGTCQYEFNVNTKYACPITSTTSSSSATSRAAISSTTAYQSATTAGSITIGDAAYSYASTSSASSSYSYSVSSTTGSNSGGVTDGFVIGALLISNVLLIVIVFSLILLLAVFICKQRDTRNSIEMDKVTSTIPILYTYEKA